MEDPWSTPWAVETPSASPGLPPTKPKTVARLPGTGTITPTEGGVLDIGGAAFENSPWGGATTTINGGFDATQQDEDKDEDAWGLWDEGKHSAWGAGHNGDAGIDAFKEPSGGFSAPWGLVGEELSAGLEGVTDSAVSLGEQAQEEAKPVPVVAVQDDTRKKATALLEDEQDAWTAPQDDVVTPPQAIADEPTSDKEPPHPAEEPKVVEQPALEEDMKEAAPSDAQTQQQKASKVQELVDMYDGIAKKAVRPPADTISRESSASGSAEASREDLTRQDSTAEDSLHLDVTMEPKSVEADEDASARTKAGARRTKDLGVADEISTLNDDTIQEDTSSAEVEAAQDTKSDENDTPGLAKAEQQSHTTKANTKHPPYPIDLSHLEALFPGSTPSTTNPEPVPDFIIDNSYTTTSERRTWYRISRFGSTRKHDSGDDEDNYKRITWGASEVRTKTLHIVRRWMEQDSIAGRVVLGSRKAGPLGASMFNWDSSEPQIEIGALLRQRVHNGNGGVHARNRSLPQADVPPQTPTMEAFGGWGAANASMPSTPSAIAQSPEFAAQIQARAGSALRPPPPDSPAEMPRSPWDNDEQDERATSMELMPPPPVPPTTDVVAEGSAEAEPEPEEVDDDDDDWGEMVSSPTVDSSTTFAPLSAPPAEPKPTPLQDSFGAGFSSLDFFEPDASAPKTARANPPPPIRTSGIEPTWTPTMNSPALEPIRASVDTARTQSAVGTPIVAGTPVVEVARSSMSSNRVSMEKVWMPVISTPTTENRLSVESAWTPVAAAPVKAATPAVKATKQPTIKRVSFEDTCTVDENAVIDEALRSLPDLSYMLR